MGASMTRISPPLPFPSPLGPFSTNNLYALQTIYHHISSSHGHKNRHHSVESLSTHDHQLTCSTTYPHHKSLLAVYTSTDHEPDSDPLSLRLSIVNHSFRSIKHSRARTKYEGGEREQTYVPSTFSLFVSTYFPVLPQPTTCLLRRLFGGASTRYLMVYSLANMRRRSHPAHLTYWHTDSCGSTVRTWRPNSDSDTLLSHSLLST